MSESEDQTQSLLLISKIIVSGADWTTETIVNQLVRNNIQLSLVSQKRDTWGITCKSRFIESLIIGLPVPQIVLAEKQKERGKFTVIDGKKRLLTILEFYGRSQTLNNSFALKNLEFLSNLDGCTYDDILNNTALNSNLNNLDNQTIHTVLIRNWHSESSLHKISLRLNTNCNSNPHSIGDSASFIEY